MAMIEEAAATLGKWGMTNIYQNILSFRCTRDGKRHRQTLTVNIFESQGSDPRKKFFAVATSDDGKTAAGNPTATVEGAIDAIHWTYLDI